MPKFVAKLTLFVFLSHCNFIGVGRIFFESPSVGSYEGQSKSNSIYNGIYLLSKMLQAPSAGQRGSDEDDLCSLRSLMRYPLLARRVPTQLKHGD